MVRSPNRVFTPRQRSGHILASIRMGTGSRTMVKLPLLPRRLLGSVERRDHLLAYLSDERVDVDGLASI